MALELTLHCGQSAASTKPYCLLAQHNAELGSRNVTLFLTQPSQPGVLLGYSRMKEEEIRQGIRRLSHVL
jgi:hypothetical protein